MKFKVLVINLDANQERLTSMTNQCLDLGIEFERVSAVLGLELSPVDKAKVYDLSANNDKYYKVLNDGEIGCYLSHMRCWEQIVAEDLDFALILEDDAVLTTEMPKFIQAMTQIALDWDYIKLSHGSKQKALGKSMELTEQLILAECAKLPATTTGQFVSNRGAHKLLATALPIARPIDIDIQFWFEKKLSCFVVRPFPVLSGDFGSEINNVADRRKTKAARVKKFILKFKYELNIVRNRLLQGKLP